MWIEAQINDLLTNRGKNKDYGFLGMDKRGGYWKLESY